MIPAVIQQIIWLFLEVGAETTIPAEDANASDLRHENHVRHGTCFVLTGVQKSDSLCHNSKCARACVCLCVCVCVCVCTIAVNLDRHTERKKVNDVQPSDFVGICLALPHELLPCGREARREQVVEVWVGRWGL